jgi:ABC-type oligopeptide transport system substrate-binding subunit/streptogramin lyase
VLPAERASRRWDRRRLRRTATRVARRRGIRLGAAAVVVAGVAAAAFLALAGSGSATRIAENSLGFVSPSGKVEGQLPTSGVGDAALLGNTLWFANGVDKVVERIDTKTRKLIHPFVSIQNGPNAVATGLGGVWVVDGKDPVLHRIDPRYQTVEHIPLPAKRGEIDFTAPTEVAVGAGSVWVAEANKVFRVDPKALRVVKVIDVPWADLVAFGNGSLWVGSSVSSTVSEIDPAINQVVKTVKLRNWVGSIAVGGGFVWATVTPDDTVWKIDEENGTVVKTIDVGHGGGDVAYFDGAVWVTSIGALQRIDPGSDQITAYHIGDRLATLAAGRDVMYVTTDESPPKLSALPDDEVATFSLAEDWLDDTDPAHAPPSSMYWLQFAYATGAQLLNYPDAAAPRGLKLQPDVAASMPTVSRDGRTYTFRIRRVFRFSPPSNQVVTAETFRYSIERALSSKLGAEAPGYAVLSDIVGAPAFHDGKAQHIAGLTASGDVLRIRLAAPTGDFLARLSLPFFAAVPIGTPIVNGGVQTPIPSAGPYYLKLTWHNELVVLERNPKYGGSRPSRLDRIVYDLNDGTHRTVERIESGDADYAAGVLNESTFAAGGPVEARFARVRATSGSGPLLVHTPQLAFGFLKFNTGRGPLADPHRRRALNYAIDRRALAAATGGRPTDAYLPPALQAPGRAPLYPMSPDVARARALLGGFHGKPVLYTCKDQGCTTIARIVRANLATVGVPVSIKKFDDPFHAAEEPGARYDILVVGWFYDWPDASDVLNLFLDPSGFRPPWAPKALPIPRSYQRQLEHAALLRGQARVDAYRRLADSLERNVAPFAAYATPTLAELFSARMGCRVEQPQFGGVNLGLLCVDKH